MLLQLFENSPVIGYAIGRDQDEVLEIPDVSCPLSIHRQMLKLTVSSQGFSKLAMMAVSIISLEYDALI